MEQQPSIGESELMVVFSELGKERLTVELTDFMDACLNFKPKILNYYRDHESLV